MYFMLENFLFQAMNEVEMTLVIEIQYNVTLNRKCVVDMGD